MVAIMQEIDKTSVSCTTGNTCVAEFSRVKCLLTADISAKHFKFNVVWDKRTTVLHFLIPEW